MSRKASLEREGRARRFAAPKVLAWAALALAAYALGLATSHYGLFPWPQIVSARAGIASSGEWETNSSYEMSVVPLISAERYAALATPARIAMVGDSTTAAGRWGEYFPAASIINRGVNGDMIGGLEQRVDAILASEPETIFVMIGINDIAARNSSVEIAKRYSGVIDALAAKGAAVHVQSVISCRDTEYVECPPAMRLEIRRLNAALRDLARAKNAIFVDIDAVLSDEAGVKEEYSVDGIHPSSAGYAAWARAIAPLIETAS